MPPLLKRLPPTPRVNLEWAEYTLIFRYKSGGVYAADGWRYGNFAVHLALPQEQQSDLWVVTHVPTRLAVVRMVEVTDAMHFAEALWDKCRDAFVEVADVDKSKVPPDVVDWIKRCDAARKLVE